MKDIAHLKEQDKNAFERFAKDFKLSEQQKKQFLDYLFLLVQASKEFNLTAITGVKNIIDFHFRDSLALSWYVNPSDFSGMVDVGTGGGLPGIPLKILYPEVPLLLIEVKKKKIEYLDTLIFELQLKNIDIYPLDWRTFLRKTDYDLNLFLSRASLHTPELMRVFKPSSPYNKATLVYWASKNWKPTKFDDPFLVKEEEYKIQNKNRKLIFFKQNS